VEQSDIENARRRVQEAAREYIPDGAVREVALLQYGDDPAVEPGQLVIRVVLPGDDTQGKGAAGEKRGRGPGPLDDFKRTHQEALERFKETISGELPAVSFIEFTKDAGPEHKARMRWRLGPPLGERPGDQLTPVMARLAATDLQTLDTLITTGIAANRADAVRWALARIRERPAYAELRERARQIEELKTQF
jgi:hypothetical protein